MSPKHMGPSPYIIEKYFIRVGTLQFSGYLVKHPCAEVTGRNVMEIFAKFAWGKNYRLLLFYAIL